MPLTEQIRKQITGAFCVIFYLLFAFKFYNGQLLYQLQPHLFLTRFDLTTWFLMNTGIHKMPLQSVTACACFDIAFYSLPIIYWFSFLKSLNLANIVAVLMLIVNWLYIQCYTLYPAGSIESFTQWLLFPILLMTFNLRAFYFVLHGLRYFFLYFFTSGSIWKLTQAGLFNIEQMSGVLLYQHKEYLASSPNDWYSSFIFWLINHQSISYVLYLMAILLELSFLIGFFTKKMDRTLMVVFTCFLLADIILMRINYFEVSPFLLTLFFSRYKEPVKA